jgi:hypothetical protein
MGWYEGTTIHDGNGGKDTAQIYRKDNGVCAIAFSATDDATDEIQQITGIYQKVTYCGLDGINAGYAQEMRQYTKLSTWSVGIAELAKCSEVWAVGHSMGGAMASLFAFCANSNNTDFQGLPEVALMTTGSPEVSVEPLYNRVPGACFRGVRTSVTHEAKEPVGQFYIDVATLFNSVRYSIDIANIKANMQDALDNNNNTAFEDLKSQLMLGAKPYLVELITTTNATIKASVQQTIMSHFVSTSIPYDPVPIFFRPYGYVHPLVAYQPMPLPGHTVPPPLVTCDSTTVPNLPNHDQLQGLLGTMLGMTLLGGSYPNHNWCNLAPDYNACVAKRTPQCRTSSCNYAVINPYVGLNIA